MNIIAPNSFSEVLIKLFTPNIQYFHRVLRMSTVTFLFGLLLILFSCGKDSTNTTPPNEETDPGTAIVDKEKATLNYRNHCGGCHGQNLGSFVEREWTYGNSVEAVLNSIQKGYVNNGMPAYNSTFSDQEVKDLTNYILAEIEGKTKKSLEEENPDLSGSTNSDDLTFRLETITDKIPGIPWGIEQLPNGEILVTERGGRLFLVKNNKELVEVTGVPNVVSAGQGGLLDVLIHPDFENNSFIYLSYSVANPNNSSEQTTAVARAKLSGNTLDQVEKIFTALPYLSTSHHYGSRLLFDRNGYLYISVGDRGHRDSYPQKLDNHLGKIHRIHDDGKIPSDNPFNNTQGAVGSVFTYGTRNPQGLSLHPETGAIWEGEHGPQGGDEINILEAGNNYGWPVISYGINYDGTTFTDITEMDGMEQPIHYWRPSIAPCGMTFVSGDFYGNWKNDLFVSSLKFEYLHRLKMNGNAVVGHEKLLEGIGRVRDAHMGKDGYLYVIVQEPGRLIRLVPEQ
ncbi:PQQ-dependent sugar dehydrogenase [Flagellimonas pacifica]|uniref:Glucose/arabinose dehydrogenase, beta-propeller fold n=1 Tax=Flagellimonas pacifica TaxID=1247520 RepID=A0A285MWM7_9FLAO|nr:PQQ-dependent sugar dehydrogenase [Allomuricauda parva]SNY99881.1 Glucose/arabinose dehydrogenase, beta-propeller fold [Allomuricauda parva]